MTRAKVRGVSALWAVGGLTAFSVSACSLLLSWDEYARSHQAPPPAQDASLDVVVPMSDASPDADSGDVSPGTAFCSNLQPPPSFCEDFDDLSFDPWELLIAPPNICGTTFDTNSFASPPASLLFTTQPCAEGHSVGCWIQRAMNRSARGVRLSFDFEIRPDAEGHLPDFVALAGLFSDDAPEAPQLFVTVEDAQTLAVFEVAGTRLESSSVGAIGPPLDGWHTVSLEVSLSSVPNRLSVVLDGKTSDHILSFFTANGPLTAGFGVLGWRCPAEVHEIRIDSVAVWVLE